MSRAWDEHNFRDPGFPGNYMPVQELSPAERQKAEKAADRRAQQMAEDYKKSVTARREADAAGEAAVDAVVAKASVIKTPRQEELERLQFVELSDGSIVHKTELQRRAAQRTPDENGVTPEQREAMEQYLAADEDEDDESFWNDE